MMESHGSIKLFGQVIFVDAEGHRDHEEEDGNPMGGETEKADEPEEEDGKKKKKQGDGASGCKPPRKPDKILPCPRCSSMDTKFCYFNNYNVNQPRHFCRDCQRYWTAGGAMRNVPVGAGRRKSKSCSGGGRHVTISEATLRAVELACREPAHGSLKFPGDGPAAGEESRAPDKSARDSHRAEKNKEAQHAPVNSVCQVRALQVPYFDGSTWLYQWNPTPVGFHLVSPYWGAAAPSFSSTTVPPPSPLGKHARGGDILKQSNNSDTSTAEEDGKQGPASVPKTMKIDNADEVARSSIWTTVGNKRSKAGGITKGGLFSAFHPKDYKEESSSSNTDLTAILSANPAAMARSLNYRESAA